MMFYCKILMNNKQKQNKMYQCIVHLPLHKWTLSLSLSLSLSGGRGARLVTKKIAFDLGLWQLLGERGNSLSLTLAELYGL